MILFTMLMSVIMPTMATALTYSLNNGDVINSYNVTSDVVTLYVGNVSVDGTSQLKYLYTDKVVNTATLTEIEKILKSDYAGLLPTIAGQVKVSNDNTVTVNDLFTDAGVVAANKYTGTVTDTSSTILYNQSQFNSLATASATEISDETTAEANNLSAWNTRKTEWDAVEQAKADEDLEYNIKDFPEEYVYAFNDTTSYPTTSYFIADDMGNPTTRYFVRNGVVAQVNTYPINRTIIKVVNTSANVETTPAVTNVVSNLEELQTALNNDSFTEVIINNAITLPNGTILDGKGKTVRVEKPYVKENGQLEESPSTTRVFTIENSSNITIKNMTIMGGRINNSAAISSNGNLTMENVNVVRSNRGLDNYGGITILKKCNFSLNVGQSAGAIWSGNGAKIILDGCSFTQNRSNGGSGYGGGAIGVSGAYLYANNTIFANNATQEIGGAINIYGGNVYLMNCTVAGNCTTKSSSCGGGIGKNGGVFHAVNSVFIDNYAKISGDKVRSDIGIYGGSGGTLNNCVYSKIQGSMSSTINCKVDESNTTASTYTDNGIILSDGSTSASFSHPVLTTGTNSYSKYVIIKNSGNAATGGINTYYDYSNTSNIKMGYGNDSSITALGGLTTPTSDKKVTTYYEGGARVYGVIGADGDTTATYSVTVTNDGNGTAEANPTSGETGTEVTLTATPKNSDYRFKEWQVISGGVTINDNKFTIGSSDVEVKAIFEEVTLNEYTVRFMDGETELSSQTITEGGHATRPTTNPTKANHEFVNWYADSTCTTIFDFNTTIEGNMCIYAKFNPVYHDVTIPLSDGLVISLEEQFTEEQTLGIVFLVEKGPIIIEEDNEADVERWYDKDRKLLFTYDKNTSTVHFADGITYKDNINYTLTDEDKELLVGYGVYVSSFILSFEEPPFEYKILEGANQTHTVNEDGSLTVKANGELSKFVKLLVDRKEVPEKDRTIVSGSTIATLSKDYLDTLSEGTHELTFVYTDGEISTNFTIAKVNTPTGTTEDDTTSNVPVTTPEVTEEETKTSNSPKTGDNITVWISLMLLSSLGIFVTYKYLRKRV